MSTKENLPDLLGQPQPTMVAFLNPAEASSQEMEPVIAGLKAKFAGKANVVTVDGPADPATRDAYHVHTYPTWILFKDGQECWRDGGRKPLSELTDMIHRFE